LGVVVVSLTGWIVFLLLIRKALALSPFRWKEPPAIHTGSLRLPIPSSPRYCTQCGSRLSGYEKFCMNCGIMLPR
jgi:hypothetical protein